MKDCSSNTCIRRDGPFVQRFLGDRLVSLHPMLRNVTGYAAVNAFAEPSELLTQRKARSGTHTIIQSTRKCLSHPLLSI